METKIKDYLQLIIAFSVAIAVFLSIQPFIQSLLNKFIASVTASQTGRFVIVIIGFGALVAAAYIIYSILTYIIRREVRKEKEVKSGN